MVGLVGPFVARGIPFLRIFGLVCRLFRYSLKKESPDGLVSSIGSDSETGGPMKSGTPIYTKMDEDVEWIQYELDIPPGGIVAFSKECMSRFRLLFGNGGPYWVSISKSPYIRLINALFSSINCSMRSLKTNRINLKMLKMT